MNRARRETTASLARDIANGAYEDVTGTRHRTPTHRKEDR